MEHLSLDFINSRYYLSHEPFVDGLSDPAWQSQFIGQWLPGSPDPWTSAAIAELAGLRSLLVSLVDNPADAERIALLNRYLSRSLLRDEVSLDPNGTGPVRELRPMADGLDLLLYRIAGSFVSLVTGADPHRLKLCENPACRWVFVDESKNNSRKWCGNTCSSLIKVRNFRERQRDHPSETRPA
jgi:predicted RNA-binding Zn ribbon-like protein